MARLISISFVVLDWSPARPLGVMGLTVTPSAGLCLTVTGLGLCYVPAIWAPAKNIPEILLGFSFAVFSTTIQDVWVIGRLGGWLFGLLVAWLFGSWVRPRGHPGDPGKPKWPKTAPGWHQDGPRMAPRRPR